MRILIATVPVGAGHVQAAAALEEAWKTLRPRDTVSRLDVLEFTPKLYRRAYVQSYVQMVAHAPELWGLLFDRTDKPSLTRRLTQLRHGFARLMATRFTKLLRRFNPNVLLATHFLPLEILGGLRGSAGVGHQPFLVSIVTDFEAHLLWMDPAVDLYCVAAEETKARLVARGAAAQNVVVTGIPIAPKFAAEVEAAAVRKRMGLRDDLATILMLGGGFGMGPMAAILQGLHKLAAAVQIIVVCGRNEELRRELAVMNPQHPTHVLGFVTNMHELMAVADLILTKPGGLTSSEALAVGKPLLVINPIPGQEAANSDFLLEHGAAAKVNRIEDLPFRLEQLLGSRKLAEMGRAAKALGKPGAAAEVCREVLRRVPVTSRR